MELSDLSRTERVTLRKLLYRHVGTPSELPDRVENYGLSQKLKSLDYDSLDHLFMQVYASVYDMPAIVQIEIAQAILDQFERLPSGLQKYWLMNKPITANFLLSAHRHISIPYIQFWEDSSPS